MRPLKLLQLKNHKVLSILSACVLPPLMYTLVARDIALGYTLSLFVLVVAIIEIASWTTLQGLRDARPWALVRSTLFYIAWILLFFLMPTPALAAAFMLVSVPVLFLGQQLVGYSGETVLITHTILTSFGLLLAAAAAEFYFHAGSLLLTVLVFICLLGLVRATYVFVPQLPAHRSATSLMVALLATEVYVAVLFLPFHFTVVGFLAFLAFYLMWLFTYYWQFGSLTKQKVKFYALVALCVALLLLLATPWRIMS